MTLRELIDHARIDDVRAGLGLPEPRHGRTCASWRGSTDRNISIHPERNVWFDHATGTGGGVLDLIQAALACGRPAALEWLANLYGVTIDSGMSPQERLAWQQRREWAKRTAAEVSQWWKQRRETIIERANELRDTDRIICRLALAALRGETHLSDSEWTFLHEYCQQLTAEAEALDIERDRLENASTPELLEMHKAAR